MSLEELRCPMCRRLPVEPEQPERCVAEAVALLVAWIRHDYGDSDFDTSDYTDVRPFVERYYAAGAEPGVVAK